MGGREVVELVLWKDPAVTEFWHVDVFADQPLSGNGPAVFLIGDRSVSAERMQRLTQEMRQFESIFVDDVCQARVFTTEEELPFAGHPLLGAGAVLHHALHRKAETSTADIHLSGRAVTVSTRRVGELTYDAAMDQGVPSLSAEATPPQRSRLAEAFGLTDTHLGSTPAMVVSTGLPYVILPVSGEGLAQARATGRDAPVVDELGADFVYLLDCDAPEGRTWDRAGHLEDIATGSAAGPALAYLRHVGLMADGEQLSLKQGRFIDRPSVLRAWWDQDRVQVGGRVQVILSGQLAI